MKKTILTSAVLLFFQIAIFAQSPVVATPEGQNPTSKNDRRDKGSYQRGQNQANKNKQAKAPASERAVQYTMQLKTALGLSDDQYQKVLAVNTECINRKDALHGRQEKGAMKTGKDDIKAYRLAEFQKIFTPAQMATFQKMKDDNREGKENNNNKKEDKKKSENTTKLDADS